MRDGFLPPGRVQRLRAGAIGLLSVCALIGVVLFPASGSARSNASPSNTSEPQLLGAPIVGSTLTATPGKWSGEPTNYSYQWRRCPARGGMSDASNCGVIPSASTSAYEVRNNDVGFSLRVRVTASNADGSSSAASNHTGVVKAAASQPAATNPPTISGTPTVGQTLTAALGTWVGTQPISFSYHWSRCDENGGSCADIGGATGKSYRLTSADAGKSLRVRVSAKNSAGTTNSTSVPTARVKTAPTTPAPPTTSGGCPTGSGAVPVEQISAPARLIVDSLQIEPRPVGSSTRVVTARFHVTACNGRNVQGALVYATTVPYNQFTVQPEQRTGPDGWVTIRMSRLSGFPAARRQQLLVTFVRARKPGENPLAGISSRRLVSVPVNLSA